MLFDRAAELGAQCLDRTRLIDVVFAMTKTSHWSRSSRCKGSSMRSRVKVVDRCHRSTVVHRKRLGLKEVNPELKKAAIWGYFKRCRARRRGQ